ncbi:MAG: CoA transferase [Dehalococcoidales bacterium]|nr:MAG: CoA transferase [Dehalococcoidales bacterium]
MSQTDGNNSALSGYRVLDLTVERGMLCSRLLADMGASVIRVEKPAGNVKQKQPCQPDNLGKRSVTLELEVERGQEVFRKLVGKTDIVVESYPPGHLKGLGLDYATLERINPRLVMASITDFGQDGPYRDYRSSDLVALALGGQVNICGEADMPPLKPFGNQAEYTACLMAAIGIMLALRERHASGRGQHLDISLQESVAATLDHVLVRYFYQQEIASRQGRLYWNNAYRVFPCRDGHILLSLFQQWQTLVEWLDDEGMAGDLTDEKWLDRDRRVEGLDHIVEVLERWTESHTVAELVEKGQSMRFPWAEIASIPRVAESPQLKERDFFIDLTDPESGKRFQYPGVPVKLNHSPWIASSSLPVAGKHNFEIYRGELGLSEEEVKTLMEEGVI